VGARRRRLCLDGERSGEETDGKNQDAETHITPTSRDLQ
jgi:hypothetical protein